MTRLTWMIGLGLCFRSWPDEGHAGAPGKAPHVDSRMRADPRLVDGQGEAGAVRSACRALEDVSRRDGVRDGRRKASVATGLTQLGGRTFLMASPVFDRDHGAFAIKDLRQSAR